MKELVKIYKNIYDLKYFSEKKFSNQIYPLGVSRVELRRLPIRLGKYCSKIKIFRHLVNSTMGNRMVITIF